MTDSCDPIHSFAQGSAGILARDLPTKKTISEFLANVDPWGIYLSEPMKQEFREETGLEPKWPEHTDRQTAKAIHDRGLGGTMKPTDEKVCWGYEVAKALARQHAPDYECNKMGRGFAFREAVEALQGAGK